MTVIAVFGSSTTSRSSPEWQEAEWLGRAIASEGWAVATGGYGGTMEAVSKGAAEVGGRVFGVIAPDVFVDRPGANPYVTDEIHERSITSRISRLIELSDAAIALPGSIGTLAELIVAWNVAFLAPARGAPTFPVAAVGGSWADLKNTIDRTIAFGQEFVTITHTAAEAFDLVRRRIPGIGRSVE